MGLRGKLWGFYPTKMIANPRALEMHQRAPPRVAVSSSSALALEGYPGFSPIAPLRGAGHSSVPGARGLLSNPAAFPGAAGVPLAPPAVCPDSGCYGKVSLFRLRRDRVCTPFRREKALPGKFPSIDFEN